MTVDARRAWALDGREAVAQRVAEIVLAMAPERRPSGQLGALSLVDDLGYDSLRLIELVIALEEHFGVRLELSAEVPDGIWPQAAQDLVTQIVDGLDARGDGHS
jgi:acyl carrier protein